MPDDNKVDPKTLADAINFAEQVYRKNNRLPTTQELQQKFPKSSSVGLQLISKHLDTSFIRGDTKTPFKPEQELEEKEDKETQEPQKKMRVFRNNETPDEESNHIETKEEEVAVREIQTTLVENAKNIITKSGYKNLDPATIDKIATEAAESASLEIVGKAYRMPDISQAKYTAADSLTQAIINHPILENQNVKTQKVYQQALKETKKIPDLHKESLQTAAAYRTLAEVGKLKDSNNTQHLFVKDIVKRSVLQQHPLAQPADFGSVQQASNNFMYTYAVNFENSFNTQVASGKTPTYKDLQKIKDSTYKNALSDFKKSTPSRSINASAIATKISGAFGMDPFSLDQLELMGLGTASPGAFTFSKAAGKGAKGTGFVLNAQRGQNESFMALLTHDKNRFQQELSSAQKNASYFRNTRNLSPSQRGRYQQAQKWLEILQKAQYFNQKKSRQANSYRSMWQTIKPTESGYSNGLTQASDRAWGVSRAITRDQLALGTGTQFTKGGLNLLANRTHGAISFSFGDFLPQKPTFGMGTPELAAKTASLSAVNSGSRIMRKVAMGIAYLNMAMLGWMLGLGKAAMTGALIGGAIGGTAGAGFGAYMGLAAAAPFGPAAPLVALVTVPSGMFLGGMTGFFVGGMVGGLIAAGIYAGSATMVTMGVGAGVGATVGAVAGFTIGTFVAAGVVTLAFAACAATGLLCFLIPVSIAVAPIIQFTFAAIGSVFGAIAGTALGYVVGKYIITPLLDTFSGIGSFFSNAGSTSAGLGVGTANFFGGLASTVWGWISWGVSTIAGAFGFVGGGFLGVASSAAGGFLGGLATVVNGAVGIVGGLGTTAAAAGVLTFGTIGAITTFGVIGSINQGSMFFNPDGDAQLFTTGDNEYFTIVKESINPLDGTLENNDLTYSVKFKITLIAKETNLTQISITDSYTFSGDGINENGSIDIASECPLIDSLAAGDRWECTNLTIPAEQNKHEDTILQNIVIVTATPESTSSPISDEATAFVIIGSPPEDCPIGWPTSSGSITQGPLGTISHANLYNNPAWREVSIDIGGATGANTIATTTFTGTVVYIQNSNSNEGYGTYIDIRGTCNGKVFVSRWSHFFINTIPPSIKVGDEITRGTEVGRVDSTGRSDGHHLHYSFHGISVDELQQYIPSAPSNPACSSTGACNVHW